MQYILTSNTKKPISVDDCDYFRLIRFKWSDTGDCILRKESCRKGSITMPCEILRRRKVMFDHKDRNYCNNSKLNLREATSQQNNCNKEKRKNCSSKFKGLCWHKNINKWHAQLKFGKLRIHLGYFENEIDAAKAYNKKALELQGEFACLNKI